MEQPKGIDLYPNMNAWQFVFKLSRHYWYYALPALAVVMLAESAGTSLTYIMKEIVDAVVGETGEGFFWASIYVGLYAFAEIGWRMSGYTGMHWITKTRSLAAYSLFSWLSHHSSNYFSDRFAGSLATKVTNASNGVSDVLPSILWHFFPVMLQLVLSMLLTWSQSHVLAGIMAAWCVVFLTLNSVLVRKKTKLSEAASNAYTNLKGQLVDIISNIRAVQQFAHLGREKVRAQKFIKDHEQKALKSWRYSEGILLFNNILQTILLGGILLTALWLNSQGKLSIGSVVMVTNLTWGILEALFFIGSSLNGLMEDIGEITEGLDVIINPHEIADSPDAVEIHAPKAEIRVDRISFSYGGRREVFKDFSLDIPAGQKVGLVGESGAGKSTFTQLLLRMYDVEAGIIQIDGQDISEVRLESLRRSISFVPQASMLFHRSLKDNIRYGKYDATDGEIIQAAKNAGAHSFIMELAEGYDTLVGERGIKLSGGQAQRISIARAMLKSQASLLILDEATSSLDSESELIVQKALEKLIEGRTVIAIAHRLSTLLAMDRIIVLDKGKIVEDGTHLELLQLGGKYARLWAHQAGGFIGGAKNI